MLEIPSEQLKTSRKHTLLWVGLQREVRRDVIRGKENIGIIEPDEVKVSEEG